MPSKKHNGASSSIIPAHDAAAALSTVCVPPYQQGPASGPADHDIGVVAKNRQRLASNGASRDMDNTGQELAGNLVHVGNHEEQALMAITKLRATGVVSMLVHTSGLHEGLR